MPYEKYSSYIRICIFSVRLVRYQYGTVRYRIDEDMSSWKRVWADFVIFWKYWFFSDQILRVRYVRIISQNVDKYRTVLKKYLKQFHRENKISLYIRNWVPYWSIFVCFFFISTSTKPLRIKCSYHILFYDEKSVFPKICSPKRIAVRYRLTACLDGFSYKYRRSGTVHDVILIEDLFFSYFWARFFFYDVPSMKFRRRKMVPI